MSQPLNKVTLFLTSIFFALLLVSAFAHDIYQFSTQALRLPNNTFDYYFQPGKTVRHLAYELKQRGVLTKPNYLIVLAKLEGVSRKLQAGEYHVGQGVTPIILLRRMLNGDTLQRSFTIVEGWTSDELLEKLHHNPYLQHTLKETSWSEIMKKLACADCHPEGRFFPETYYFTRGSDDINILKRAYQLMTEHLEKAWQERAPALKYKTAYQALIVASMIEKETAKLEERAIIAGVILNRWRLGMHLQIDPSVIYGLNGSLAGKLNKRGLAKDTPYNTYLHRGLPPTPIAMPSAASIHAALQPQSTDYLFFVAKGDGYHQFSRTLAEQTKAIRNLSS